MIDIDIQISILERSSGWATNYRPPTKCGFFKVLTILSG